jgi:hypothetical protein
MDPEPKVRPDAKLKTLPEERQAEISEYALHHTLDQTIEWLGANGIQITIGPVSEFLSWYRAKHQMTRSQLVVQELASTFTKQNPDLTPERVDQIGHMFFSSMAIEKQDPRAWYLAQQIACRKSEIQLAFQKYHDQVQARKEAIQRELDLAKSKGGLSPETIEKIEHELNLF